MYSGIDAEEQSIARSIVQAGLDRGYEIITFDGEENSGPFTTFDEVWASIGETDYNWVHFNDNGQRIGGILLVWGNGEDVVSDVSYVPKSEPTLRIIGQIEVGIGSSECGDVWLKGKDLSKRYCDQLGLTVDDADSKVFEALSDIEDQILAQARDRNLTAAQDLLAQGEEILTKAVAALTASKAQNR